jgi:casein kinase I family protein HRR25
MGLKSKTKKEKYENIRDSKKNTTLEDLLDGHPVEFVKYMKYCRNLQFNETPNYVWCRKLFEGLL